MFVESMEIIGLFGQYNHTIPFMKDDRITIIHGVNGVGKTTILRLLKNLYSSNFKEVLRVPFDTINLSLVSNENLRIERVVERETPKLKLYYTVSSLKKPVSYTYSGLGPQELRHRRRLHMAERGDPYLDRIGADEWLDVRTGRVLSRKDVINRRSKYSRGYFIKTDKDIPRRLEELLDISKVYLIETQRLFTMVTDEDTRHSKRHSEEAVEMTVEEYSSDLVNRIKNLLRESAGLAAKSDREFPGRLLQTELPETATVERIKQLYTDQMAYRRRLMATGLLDSEPSVPLRRRNLDEMERKVLWIYLADIEKKFQQFDDLLKRTELLLEIINTRFSDKVLSIDKEKGFVFTSVKNNSNVPNRSLSSGEQHELVLAYDLLFNVKQNSLVLIDEPELSLHVTWQRKFLEDIAKISKLADLDFLVATHAPGIIHGRNELMVPLGE